MKETLSMNKITTSLAAGLLSVALIGCGATTSSSGSGGSSGACASGTGGSGSCSTSLVATECNDYRFSSTLSLSPVSIKPKAELTFEWGDMTHDFIKHHLDPKADLDQILMFLWKLNQSDLQRKLNNDELSGTDLVAGVPLTYMTDHSTTHASLFDFKIGSGEPITQEVAIQRLDPVMYPPDRYTYTLMAATGMNLGSGVRMIQAFKLDASSSNTSVKLDDNSTGLEYQADLHSLQPTTMPAGQAGVKIEWGGLKKDALEIEGMEFDPTSITEVMLGHYTETPTELEGAKFLDLDMIAKELYKGKVESGTSVDFSTLKTDSGTSFSGIDSSGTWLVALRCGNCRNPAPRYLTILKPCS
jgi:hypothetical protein